MEGHQAMEDEEKGSLAVVSSSGPPAPVNISSSLTCESVIENKGVAMASNDVSSALSSPAEASPAKPAVSSPTTTFKGIIESSPAVSGMASASDSLTINGTSQLLYQSCSWPPCTVFGDLNNEKNFPSVLTFKGVSVTLENHSVWKQFYSCGTEMILTKQGRRMFPYCRYRLKGLDPNQRYILVLSIVPSDQFKYRWNSTSWEVIAQAENQCQGLVRAFSHHNSPALGLEWMSGLVSFYRLKITNDPHSWQDDHMVLHSMHRYIPRLNVIPVPDGQLATPDQPFVKGPESMTFTFPQTEFMAVTTYQNFRITQLKITYNPFAKGFREDGSNCILDKLGTDGQPAVKKDPDQKPAERVVDIKEEPVDLSMKKQRVPASPANAQETRLVLKPIMSKASKDDPQAIKIIRHDAGKHALSELVLVQRAPTVDPKDEKHPVSVTTTLRQCLQEAPKVIPITPVSSRSTLASSQGYGTKRRKRMNRRWAKSLGKAVAASPAALRSPSLSVSMQPEVDDVEGLLFASFISKEALEIHAGDKPANGSASASPVAKNTPMRCEPTAEESPENFDETITCLEAILLQDLKVLKHRQVIHPVLQEVGLKLSSLDQSKTVDLQYLGVRLPLPATVHPEQNHGGSAPSGGDTGLPFISRTGKTSDVTKIKGWKNKFISSKETSKCDGPQKDLSAFCSNMLDEYLESEAQQISERAATFSTSPEDAVAYQLPAKSSSYVKTLDSVLKRKAAAKSLRWANRPCPLSHKPLLYSTLMSPAPPLSSPISRVKAEAEPVQEFASGQTQERPAVPAKSPPSGPNAAFMSSSPVSPRLFKYHQKPAASFGQSHGAASKPLVLSKVQLKLLEMEMAAVNRGLSQTHLTTERLSVALSVLLTAKMQFNQHPNAPLQPWLSSEGPPCGQEFCRLGCVCSSIQHPVRAITNVEHILQPLLGIAKLWNCNTDAPDTEPLFTPKSAAFPVSSKVQNHSHRPRPKQPIREENKDPVYKHFESTMTCARVRQFNRKSPPDVTPEPRDPVTATPIAPKESKTTTTKNLPKNYHRTILAVKHSGKSSPGAQSSETEAKKQVEIQSACQWDKDHKVVLEALCLRMNQNRLSQRFFVGPYHIRPVSKIHMRKPSGSIITYRVHISKPMRDSDDDDDEEDEESDVSDEDNISDASADGDPDEKEEFDPAEEPEMKFGVTPFLSSVLPAGSLKATKKTIGCQASGLVQVNGKSYNQAKLLLGNMGSLHPANRLAAYLTGRLRIPHKFKTSEKTKAAHKLAAPGALQIQTAGSVVPSSVTARKTSDLKTPQQPAAPQLQQQAPPTTNPSTPFVSNQSSFLRSFQNRSASTGVLLTVSPSLKTPGFLTERGTYSFRICPPSGQSTKGQNLPGVTLPGGFTLIDLPKPGAHSPPALTGNTANTATNGARPQKDDLFRSDRSPANSGVAELDLSADRGCTRVMDRLSVSSAERGSSAELTCDESDDAQRRPMGLEESNASESSDSSDYAEDDEDEPVDVERVEEMNHNLAIAKMREVAKGDVKQESSRISSVDFDSAERLVDGEESKGSRRPLNHTVGERFRRFQQRFLFNKLKTLLKCDARASKVTLLTLAIHEIQTLVKASACLEQKKRMLIEMQSGYLRKISILSGKSRELIKNKLMEICNKQKLIEQSAAATSSSASVASLCSRLPRHKSAHLQVKTQQPKPGLKSQSRAEGLTSPQLTVPQTTAQTLGPGVSPRAPDKVLALQSKVEDQRETPAASSQAAARTPSDAATAQVTSAQPSPSSQTVTYPLVRSKTGRIILPSSLKSPMQGLYKLMVMKGEQSESSSPQTQSAQSQERSVPEPDSGSSRAEDDLASPLSMIARLNKSISSVSVAMQHANLERDAILGLNKTVATYHRPVIAPCAWAISRLGRARPPTNTKPVTPGGGNEKLRPVEKADKETGGEQFGVVEQTETKAEGTPGNIGEVENYSTPAKRGRGRPPRKRKRPEDTGRCETSAGTEPNHKTPATQTGSSHLMVSPVRWPGRLRSPVSKSKDGPVTNLLPGGVGTSRPLTRGALGKDFPSAKKRSWIDVEKELEQEME